MKSRWTILALALLLNFGCASMRVHVDYDRSADLHGYRTYMWEESSETSLEDSAPLMHRRIENAVDRQLAADGLEKVTSDPDLYVTYHTDESKEFSLNTTHFGYGYGPDWYWDPYWPWGGAGVSSSHTTVHSYSRGTLIVDLWDAKEKRVVWRGSAQDIVPENPEKAGAKIDKAVSKMGERFREMAEKD